MAETIKLILVFALVAIALWLAREREETLAYATELEIYMESKGLELPDNATLKRCAEEWEAKHDSENQAAERH